MSPARTALCAALLLAACAAPEEDPAGIASSVSELGLVSDVTREHVVDDVYHYSFILRVGDAPNARLRLHRVVRERDAWRPRPTYAAAMLVHGDFASFVSNFVPSEATPGATDGLATHLAKRGVDVWGMDRRWGLVPAGPADVSDFPEMGFAQEVDDIGAALGAARALRIAGGDGAGKLHLVGFSRGGLLSYAYAVAEAGRPAFLRHLAGLVPLDVYAVIAPEDEELRLGMCAVAALDRATFEAGVIDSDNSFFSLIGALALEAPDEPSPIFPGTNRDAMLLLVGQTYLFFNPTPRYHLAAGRVVDGAVVELTESPEPTIAGWLIAAPPHQSMREIVEGGDVWCGENSPVSMDLSRIRVPLYYLGAAGGFGDHGLYSTTQVASSDVTTRVVSRLPADRVEEDFGHADLLFARDAEALAWTPLGDWLLAHR